MRGGHTVPISDYVRSLRARIGPDFLLLPGVSAVIRHGEEYLLARHRDSSLWSFIGGGVEPGESPKEAVQREVREEIGVIPTVIGLIGAYGGRSLEATAPNGDRVGYVTVAYRCVLPSRSLLLEEAELLEVAWFSRGSINMLDRHPWIDRVLQDDAGGES
jgi:8-oxo-dGTP pyrophosphatase MutT (NUDIX family)